MLALIDMGVTPFIYTEGKYNSRLEQLADVPAGKVIYHFESVDMAQAKKGSGQHSMHLRQHVHLSAGTRNQATGH